MLLEISGEITPVRMKRRSQKENNTQLWMCVITDLEPDILEFKVKWALGSITTNKASRGDEIPVELLQILKMML